jgi:DNA helicase-2/ATP-dependent DNA helicase PcrA
VGSQSKKVKQAYDDLLEKLGSEFLILHSLEKEAIEKSGVPLLGEAIDRMRKNEVTFFPGYDGLFGKVQLFSVKERDRLLGQQSLFAGFEVNKIEKENPMDPWFFPLQKVQRTRLKLILLKQKGISMH